MRRQQTIPIQQTCVLEKVQKFLNSIGRNSQQSKRIYGIALSHFQAFVMEDYSPSDIETILDVIKNEQVNVYALLDNFVSFLLAKKHSPNSVSLYVAATRSYFAYHDIDVVPSKFKRKVRMPKRLREDEEAIDAADIRRILLSCSNRRLKAYLLVLASSGARAVEALAIRNKDCDFSTSPAKIHIRKEYAKTRVARDVYISEEASAYIQKEWLEWKYTQRRRKTTVQKSQDDLIFSIRNIRQPERLYERVTLEFKKVLKTIGLDERKEGMLRRRVTLHSFRRNAKTIAATQTNTDYSEWLLGHQKSPYWTMKEVQRREIYASKIMPYLTFLDYSTLEATGKNIETKLEEKDKEIQFLKNHYDGEMKKMREDMDRIFSMIQQNPQLAQIKPEVLKRKKLPSL
jgi:integrase